MLNNGGGYCSFCTLHGSCGHKGMHRCLRARGVQHWCCAGMFESRLWRERRWRNQWGKQFLLAGIGYAGYRPLQILSRPILMQLFERMARQLWDVYSEMKLGTFC